MVRSVTHEVTLPAPVAIILKIQLTISSWAYNTYVKIYQMRIVKRVTLGIADSMWIVTGITGCFFGNNMFIMNLQLHIISNICAVFITVMARVAQFISKCRLNCNIGFFILIF